MPPYTVMTQDGLLSAEQRDASAAELVRTHTAATGVPADFVHSIFPTYPRNQAYVATDRSPLAFAEGRGLAARIEIRTRYSWLVAETSKTAESSPSRPNRHPACLSGFGLWPHPPAWCSNAHAVY